MTLSLLQRSALEALGTAFLAFTIGRVGSSDLNGFEQAMAIGLCLTLLIHVIGRFSGAHFNPAVTVLLTIQRYWQHAFRSVESWSRQVHTSMRRSSSSDCLFGASGVIRSILRS